MSTATKKRRNRKSGGSPVDTESTRAGDASVANEGGGAGNGECKIVDGEANAIAMLKRGNGRTRVTDAVIDSLCVSLQSLERQRRFALKQCIRGENAITAFVAWNACGFHTGILSEAEREKLWKKAGKLIKSIDSGVAGLDAECKTAAGDESTNDADGEVVNGDQSVVIENRCATGDERRRDTETLHVQDDSHPDTEKASVTGVVRISQISRKAWAEYEKGLVAEMVRLAGQLPVAVWLDEPACRGISLGMLATIVGESGNLSNYPNPAKLWKRLFGAPYEKNGKTMMPSRWRLEKGLSSEEWEEIGYSPQRHATQQQLKENIVRQNGEGPYRQRYDEAKARTRETHPEWWVCSKCEGKGKVGRKKCQNCKGTGEVALHAHRHAQLLAAKRFIRDLWNKWHGVLFDPENPIVPRDGA